MHESGMISSLLNIALQEASNRGSSLRGVTVRLGVLSGGSVEHFREHFESELGSRNLNHIKLTIIEDQNYLGSLEIVSIDLVEPSGE
jgi:Zn finger protein HypA/HybF involved in hydrogenase expression